MRPFVYIISFLFLACNNSSTELKPIDKDTTEQFIYNDGSIKQSIAEASKNADTNLYVWLVDFDNKTKRKNPHFEKQYLNVDTLIKGINQLYPNIKLEKVKIKKDTLFTKIVDSEYLGERMGTNGAALYLARVIINLTSVNKIKFVKMDFDEGSHASPGIWSAKDFIDYREIK